MTFDIFSITKVVVLGVAALAASACTAMPWWFKFHFIVSRDGGKTVEIYVADVGLFFMDKGELLQTDLIFVDKATNAHVVPDLFKMGQLFFAAGSMGLLVCFGTSLLYMFRKYRSSTGEMCLAGGISPCAVSLLLGLGFAVLGVTIEDLKQRMWEQFPIPNFYVRQYAFPAITIEFVVYIAGIAVLCGAAAAFLFWMHACILCRHVERVRYQMLTAPLTEDERGVGPGTTYRFQKQNPGFRYDGYSKPTAASQGMVIDDRMAEI